MSRFGQDEENDRESLPSVESTDTDEHHWGDVRSAAQEAVRHASARGESNWRIRFSRLSDKKWFPVATLATGIVLAVLIGYFAFGRSTTPSHTAASRQPAPSSSTTSTTQPTQPQPSNKESESGLSWLFGASAPGQEEQESWPVLAAKIVLKLALGALLAALLAFRPRRDMPVQLRNPYVAQTQILLAVVAAALMMVVSDNAARAFGIFAAASLVRFRTNIRDPKEITVLLISLGIGLAAGVGKFEVAIILALFVLVVLSVLEYFEPEQIFRAMELTVGTKKVDETDEALREVFDKRNITSELRKVDREDDENPVGKIVYHVDVNGHLSTDQLSEDIFSSDPENIDSIQWDQKKTASYVYR